MNPKIETQNFLNDLDRVATISSNIAGYLAQIADILTKGEVGKIFYSTWLPPLELVVLLR